MKKILPVVLSLALAFAGSFSLVACGGGSASSADEEGEKIAQTIDGQITIGKTYCFSLEGSEGTTDYYMDADGNYITDKISITPINDVLTDEISYYLVTEDVSEGSDEYIYYKAIYSVDGDRLCPFTLDNFGSYSIGGYVLRSNYMIDESEADDYDDNYYLWDLDGEKIVREGVYSITRIDDKHAIASNSDNRMLGILGSDGEYTYKLSTNEMYYNPDCANGYFMVTTSAPDSFIDNNIIENEPETDEAGETIEVAPEFETVIADEEGNISYDEGDDGSDDVEEDIETEFVAYKIFDGEMKLLAENDEDFDISIQNVIGKYFTKTDDDVTKVVSIESGEELATGSAILYYDGEYMINSVDESCYLCDGSGEKLSKGYSLIAPSNTDSIADGDKADYFIAWDSDRVAVLDKDGQEKASVDVDGAIDVIGYDEYISVTTMDEENDGLATLYDSELNLIISSEKKYNNIMLVEKTWVGETPEGIFVCAYYDEDYNTLVALVDEEGELIVDGIKAIDVVDEEHFACIIGDEIGFIDLDGTWTKHTKIELPLVIEQDEFEEADETQGED